MELWITLATASAFLWTLIVLLDKFVLDSEIENPYLGAGLHCTFNSLTITVVALYFGEIHWSLDFAVAGTVIAGLYVAANYLWFSGVKKEEVSRFAPVLSVDVLFIALFSLIFLGQSFSLGVYAGMSLTVVGSILISLEDPLKNLSKVKSKWALGLAIGSAFLFAVREIFFKYFTGTIETWNLIFYFGLTGTILSSTLIFKERKGLKNHLEGIELLAASGVLSGFALAVFYQAIAIGPVSLVSTITKTRFLLIFFGATLITRLHPEIIHEPLEKRILIQKMIATIMIITGVTIATVL